MNTLPICLNCGKIYRVVKNGVVINAYNHSKSSDKIRADLIECTKCGSQVLLGFSAIFYDWENAFPVDFEIDY